MANKNTDLIEMLADSICNSLVSASARAGKETAPNDKTFATVICGVNQKFTDDISDEDKNNTINKYSIPESIDDGENSYYTFKIDGAIYCKRQNGNFKLYDKVMVYIPNGDWSNMYFDYPDASSYGGGGGGGSSTDGHQLIVSVDAPGGDNPQLGDMWLFVRDETRTTFTELEPSDYAGMYTWQIDEDTQVQSWNYTTCTVSESAPSSGNKVGNLWIKLQNDHFNKIYLCTSTEGATVWSEVYPDDETGEGYNLFISADKPLSEGDYWAQIDNDTSQNIQTLSQYKFNSTLNKFDWKLLYNASVPAVYIQPTDPATTYDVKRGDYWIKISDDGEALIYNISKWVNDIVRWVRECVAGGDLIVNISHAILVQKDEVQ